MNIKNMWFPYTQMKSMAEPLGVKSAQGVYLELADGRKLIDSISSWWTAIHGYNHPEITEIAKNQLDNMAHVMLGGLVNEPASILAARLAEIAPGDLKYVFYGDSGSVGVEIAIKMAVQYWTNKGNSDKQKLLALEKAYHGDTIGAMSVCDPVDGMHKQFSSVMPAQLFIPSPIAGFDAELAEVQKDIDILDEFLREHHSDVAAFILEPVMQAAGGFNFYSPHYISAARKLCDQYEVLLIFDEVATGFGRTGKLFAANHASVTPDIMVLGKALTAGYLGHSATLATGRIFEAFQGDSPELAFMHGPTFMGNPLACAIALKSVEIFQRDNYLEKINTIEEILNRELIYIKSPKVKDVRVLGATGVVEVEDVNLFKGLQEFAVGRGVWLRPFDKYVYTMPPYIITEEELIKITSVLHEWFT